MTQDNKYKAGVLILGSLYWDVSHDRMAWRNHAFGENYAALATNIKVPIRYGRFSEGRQCPTIVFSHEFKQLNKLGNAKVLPFKNQKLSLEELHIAAKDLSQAEGSSSRTLIKGNQNKWCIVVAWINPKKSEDLKNFRKTWKKAINQHNENDSLIGNFKMNSEKDTVVTSDGTLNLDWPDSLVDYDLVFATQTRPRKAPKDYSAYLSPDQIATQIFKKPEYFIKNCLHGMTTQEDVQILDSLKSRDKSTFRKKALKNGCTISEFEAFWDSNFS